MHCDGIVSIVVDVKGSNQPRLEMSSSVLAATYGLLS
jgi:hypothetical protein